MTQRAKLSVARVSGVFVWLGFILIFGLWKPDTFLTQATAQSIAGDQAITVILAMGVLFALACGEFDLSFAQNLGLAAVIAASLMVKHDVAPGLAVLITLLCGVAIGAVNGALVAGVGVNSFVATLGMSSVLLAVTELISNQAFIGPLPGGFQSVARHEPLGVPIVAIYAAVVAILVWWALEHTPFGRRTQATGANADAARLAGVPTRRLVFVSFLISGFFGSLAGILVAARIGSVSPQLGPPYLLPAFAACFLGATQIKPGRFNVWGTVLALYLLATGVKGLQLVGGQLWVTDMFNGVALAGAVTIAVLAQKRRSARLRAATEASAGAGGTEAQAAATAAT